MLTIFGAYIVLFFVKLLVLFVIFYQIENKNWNSQEKGWFSELFGNDQAVSSALMLLSRFTILTKYGTEMCVFYKHFSQQLLLQLFCFLFQQIQYSDHYSQFAFLQVTSLRATQKITYHCKNSVAWLDEKMNTYDKSLKLLALNGYEYSREHHKNAQPKVISDGCKVGLL